MGTHKPDPGQQEFGFMKTVHTMTPEERRDLLEELDRLEPRKFLYRAIEVGLTTEEKEKQKWEERLETLLKGASARTEKMIRSNSRQFRYGEKQHLEFMEKNRRELICLPLVRYVALHFPVPERIYQHTPTLTLLGQLQLATKEDMMELLDEGNLRQE